MGRLIMPIRILTIMERLVMDNTLILMRTSLPDRFHSRWVLAAGEDSLMTYYKGETRYRDIWCAIGLENVWPGLEYGANSGTVTMTAIAKDSISGYFGFHLIGNDSSEHTLTGSFTCVAP